MSNSFKLFIGSVDKQGFSFEFDFVASNICKLFVNQFIILLLFMIIYQCSLAGHQYWLCVVQKAALQLYKIHESDWYMLLDSVRIKKIRQSDS